MANDMAYVHNAFIRGFNSIILQGPHLPSHDQSGFIAKDVKDFMIFTDSLIKSLDHHHTSEEKVAFPEIEKEIGLPGYLSVAAEQHHIFHDGLHALWDYAKAKQDKPEKYKWEDMEKLMNEFMPALQKHLVEEVDLFLTLDRFDEEGLRKAWKFIEGEAKTVGIAGFVSKPSRGNDDIADQV
jgi:hemerythrin-like domain-containing protein